MTDINTVLKSISPERLKKIEARADKLIKERKIKKQQPAQDPVKLAQAISRFQRKLPGWWFTVGVCSVTRDVSCGPEINGPDADLLHLREFDEGFHLDCPRRKQVADVLEAVMIRAMRARAKIRKLEK